jgi:hypothetical protein
LADNDWSPKTASVATNEIHFHERLKETKSNYQYSKSYQTQNPFESKLLQTIYILSIVSLPPETFGLKQSLP